MFVKGKVLSWIFKNEKCMWMVGIDWKEQEEVFSSDGNVLYFDGWLQGCVYICQNLLNCTLNISAFTTCKYYLKKRKKCVLNHNYVNL